LSELNMFLECFAEERKTGWPEGRYIL